ncbi:transmembrane protein 267 [Venturia canescens]|uniref:transmembrane protein 267 n=1 Tax=Venturia canescens TaxID=32260 RepID=UPI001C9CA709|nr:transmembrane protein 267 [Venturia canescens]
MFQSVRYVLLQFCATSLLGVVSCTGDRLVDNSKNNVIRASFDNLTHAIIGGLSWILVLILSKKSVFPNIYSVIYCTAISSLIDLDHFIAAASLKLRDATHLDRRPFLHNTTIPLVLWIVLMLSSRSFNSPGLNNFAWIVLTSFLSHHIRDGSRRGLWFAPFGSTPPIPYYLYVAFSMGLPYIIYWLMFLIGAPIIKDRNYQPLNIV